MTFQLLFALCLLVGCIIACLYLLKYYERDAQMRKRITAVVTSQTKVKPVGTTVSLFTTQRRNTDIISATTRLFGVNLDRQDQYPVFWPIPVLGALVGAYCLAYVGRIVLGNFATLLTPFIWWALCRAIFSYFTNRHSDQLFRQFPDALAMIVRSVRVGIPVTEAVRAVAREIPTPTGPEFGRLAHELGMGVSFEDALLFMSERNDLSEYRFFATALSLQTQTGGALSETLENLADVIRKRVAVRERGKALAAEAKTSAGILAALPPLSGAGLYALNSEYMGILFHDPLGQKVLMAAAVMLFGGIMSMRTIIRKSLQ